MKQLIERFDTWLRKKNEFGVPNVIPVVVWLIITGLLATLVIIQCA